MQLQGLFIRTIRRWRYLELSKFYQFDKEQVSFWLFFIAVFFAINTSIHVSFLWKLESVYFIVVSALLFASMLISNSMDKGLFTRKDFMWATIWAFLVLAYQNLVNGQNLFSLLASVFHTFIFFAVFRLDKCYFQRFTTILCKLTAILIAISMFAFFMFLLGIGMPNSNAEYGDMYYFTNYYFFLLDDRSLIDIIPRFHSVFLEPGHMGTYLVLLLSTQIGKWKTWYNMIMLLAVLISFSLAAYGLLVILTFLHLWIKRRKIILKVVFFISLIAAVVGGSYVYDDGDNMLNRLIVMRLEMNQKGDDIEGNNRVTADFESEFDSFMQSSDIFLGREMDKTIFGNSGYRVYLYDYGFVGMILLFVFYVCSVRGCEDHRAVIAMFALSIANFWIRSYPMMYAFYIPYYFMANLSVVKSEFDAK